MTYVYTKTFEQIEGWKARIAEGIVMEFFRRSGFEVIDHPWGDTGADIYVKRNGKSFEEYVVEVEQLGHGRPEKARRYGTLNVLGRRKVHGEIPTLFFHVTDSASPKLSYVVFENDFLHFPTIVLSSANNPKGDLKKQIPLERVLVLDMGGVMSQTIAQANLVRVWKAMTSRKFAYKKGKFLEPSPLFGVEQSTCDLLDYLWSKLDKEGDNVKKPGQ
jgi:hypothetical protein